MCVLVRSKPDCDFDIVKQIVIPIVICIVVIAIFVLSDIGTYSHSALGICVLTLCSQASPRITGLATGKPDWTNPNNHLPNQTTAGAHRHEEANIKLWTMGWPPAQPNNSRRMRTDAAAQRHCRRVGARQAPQRLRLSCL